MNVREGADFYYEGDLYAKSEGVAYPKKDGAINHTTPHYIQDGEPVWVIGDLGTLPMWDTLFKMYQQAKLVFEQCLDKEAEDDESPLLGWTEKYHTYNLKFAVDLTVVDHLYVNLDEFTSFNEAWKHTKKIVQAIKDKAANKREEESDSDDTYNREWYTLTLEDLLGTQ